MQLDPNTRLRIQLGDLLLSNLNLAHSFEEARAEAIAQKARADALQAEKDAATKAASDASEARAKFDAAVDKRDEPSGAPAPVVDEQLP